MSRLKVRQGIFLLVLLLLVTLPLLVACKGPAGPQGAPGSEGPAGAPGPAGSSVGIIWGTIKDSAGAGISGATVVTTPATTTAATDASGNYQISSVPLGAYKVKAARSGYNANAQTNVSVRADQTSTVNLTLATAAAFPMGKVIGISAEDDEVYANSQVWLTLTGGYATHDNANIITSGLNNVGVGSYVYFKGADKDKAGKSVTAWVWQITDKPMQSTATLENATTQEPRLLTDKPGKYTIEVTGTNSDEATSSSSLEVYAGTYVGVKNCATCHSGNVMPDMVSQWEQTGHATKFEDVYGSYYSGTSDYCVGCHTTGYNETDKAGGFDDLARYSGWNPATDGSLVKWLKVTNLKTIDDVRAMPVAALMNIQCESCHGPGSVHTEAKSFEPSVCSQCHGQAQQWENSGHAEGEAVGAQFEAAGTATCVACHTAQGFVQETIGGMTGIYPDQATADEPATLPAAAEMSAITCAACHDPHQATNPETGGSGGTMRSNQLRLNGAVTLPIGVTVDAEESAVCVTCHNGRRDAAYLAGFIAGSNTRGPHGNVQGIVLYGVKEYAVTYDKTLDNSPHTTVVEEGCAQCHMAGNPVTGPGPDGTYGNRDDVKELSVGGHSWNMMSEQPFTVLGTEYTDNIGWWTTQGTTEVSLGGACNVAGCHKGGNITASFDRTADADFDGDGTVEGVQTEVQGLLDALKAELPQNSDLTDVLSYPINAQNTTEAQRKALWNYWLVRNDGSLGIHNTKFVVELLQESYKQLTGNAIGTPPPVPPQIVHVSTLSTDCTSCHGATVTVDMFATGSHAGRTNASCTRCHQEGTPPVAIPVSLHQAMYPSGITASGATSCSACHSTGAGGAPKWTSDHANRTNAMCNSCHTGP